VQPNEAVSTEQLLHKWCFFFFFLFHSALFLQRSRHAIPHIVLVVFCRAFDFDFLIRSTVVFRFLSFLFCSRVLVAFNCVAQRPARWKGGRVYDEAKWKQTLHYPSHGKVKRKEGE
jgi:hypothetical protein